MGRILALLFMIIFATAVTAMAERASRRISLVPADQAAAAADTTPPAITITSPEVKRGVKLVSRETAVTVTGRAADAGGVSSVVINNQPAALDEQGNFSLELLLKPGDNRITVTATDIYKNSATEKFTISREAGPAPAKPAQAPAVAVTSGCYHALIIGINDYRSLDRLKTAVNDAQEVESILKRNFGFQTRLLLNPGRDAIMRELNELRKRVSDQDSVLIYYAGHGEFDRSAGKAFWLPVDAQRDDDSDWIIADNITASIKRLPARHVMIVSDSCYSGTLTRSSQTHLSPGERNAYLAKIKERSSRTLMASGGNEPVADGGGSGHSIFADSFLKALNDMDEPVFSADELFFKHIKSRVAGKSDQVPEYNEIRNSGHDGGDFVFVKAR